MLKNRRILEKKQCTDSGYYNKKKYGFSEKKVTEKKIVS